MKATQSHAQNSKLKKTLLDLKNQQTAGYQDELLTFCRGELVARVVMVATERNETA